MNVFDIIPSDFFNCLSGNSNNRVYADCLELIHNQYDKEISYRLERSYLRDVLAAFLLENHLDLTDEENTANAGNDEANFVLRKFISVGWLEEDQDDSTFEKYIVMTDNGITLAEFLHKLKRPATPEFSSYMEKVMFGDRLFNRVKESDFVVFGGMSKGSETRERDWHKNLQIAYEKGKKLFGTNQLKYLI